MAVSLLEGLAQLFLVCCILPIILLIIWIVIILLIIRSEKYKNTLIILISVVMAIWISAIPIFGFGLTGNINRTYNQPVEIPPGETWEVSGSMDDGNIIEVEFSANHPLEIVYIAKVTRTYTECSGYGSAYDEAISSLSTVAQSSTSGQDDYKVSEDGSYRVIFYNSNNSQSVKTDIYVKFRDRDVENILLGGAILLGVGIAITIVVIIFIKKFEQENVNV